MTKIYIVIFALLFIAIAVIFQLFKRDPIAAAEAKQRKIRRQNLIGKKQNRIQRLYYRIDYLLQIAKMSWSIFIVMILAIAAALSAIGYVIFRRSLLILACGVLALPVAYILLYLRTFSYRRLQNEQLEHSMSIILNTYRETGDIIKSIAENIEHILPKEPFEEFLLEVTIIDPNINRALRRLEIKINNSFFSQWIDMLILSQTDRNMIFLLPVIINDMNDARSKQNAAIAEMATLWRDFFLSLIVVLSAPLVIRFVNIEWYYILIGTPIGNLLIVILLLCLLFAFWQVAKISKPVE